MFVVDDQEFCPTWHIHVMLGINYTKNPKDANKCIKENQLKFL